MPNRSNGGFIGTTNTSAGGIFSLRNVEVKKGRSEWVSTAYNIQYLVVGGGAGGSGMFTGGSGGGGQKNGTIAFEPGVTLTCTVGSGGAPAHTASNNASSGILKQGYAGGSSSIAAATITTITALTGGLGRAYENNAVINPNTAGTGGGGYGNGTAGAPAPNDGQGYAGGTGSNLGGGGGGAGGNGNTGQNAGNGNGGAGYASSITGSSINYGAGGGAATHYYINSSKTYGGDSANGGGGDGHPTGPSPGHHSTSNLSSMNGAANRGNAGGSSHGENNSASCSGSGGSGVVILRVPTANYSGTTTGSPTITTDGTDTVIKFTGSGTYTA